MILDSQATLENYKLTIKIDETSHLISEFKYTPELNEKFKGNITSDELYLAIQESELSFKEKYIALKLLEKSLENLSENPPENAPEGLVCPCFKIYKKDLSNRAFRFHKQFYKKSLKDFLLNNFPIGSACDSCIPVFKDVASEISAENFRENEWKGKSNVQWTKDIYLQLPEDVEIYDFYNGKLFLKSEIPEPELQEVISNYFNYPIKVLCLPTN